MKAHRVLVVSGSRESALMFWTGVGIKKKGRKKDPGFAPLPSTPAIVQPNATRYDLERKGFKSAPEPELPTSDNGTRERKEIKVLGEEQKTFPQP